MVWSHMSVDLTPRYMVWKKIDIECVGSSWWCLAGVQSGPAAVPTPPCSGGCRQSGHAITTTLHHQHSLCRNFTQDPQIVLVLFTRFIIHHALSTWDKVSKMVYVRWQCFVVSLSPPVLNNNSWYFVISPKTKRQNEKIFEDIFLQSAHFYFENQI